MKRSQLLNMTNALNTLILEKISFEEAENVVKLTDLIEEEMETINKTKEKVFKAHGVTDINLASEETKNSLNQEFDDFMNKEIEVIPFTIHVREGMNVPPIWLRLLRGVVTFTKGK